MDGGLARRAGSALMWSAVQLLGTKLISLVTFVVLARLLAPEDFGLVAIATVVIEMFMALSNVGVSQALVQLPDASPRDYDTAWTLGVIRAAAVAVAVAATSPLLAEAFAEPRAAPLIAVLGLRPFVESLWSVGLVGHTKGLRFGRIAAVQTSAAAAGSVGVLALAILLPVLLVDAAVAVSFASSVGAWAVVIGSLAGSAFGLAASYRAAPHRPRFVIDRTITRGLLRFGRWLLAASVVGVAGHLVLRAIVSNRLGVAELGAFYLAVKITVLPNDVAGEVVRAVVFPLVAAVQGDEAKARRAFQGGLTAMAVLLLPVYALMFALAEPLVEVVLGSQWTSIVPVVQILALDGVVDILADAVKPLVLGMGHPQRRAFLKAVRTLVIIVLAWPLIEAYGVVGAALAWLAAESTQLVFAVVVVRRTLADALAPMAPALTGIGVAAVAGAGLGWVVASSLGGLAGLAVAVAAGLAVAAVVMLLADRRWRLGLGDQLSLAFPAIAGRLGLVGEAR